MNFSSVYVIPKGKWYVEKANFPKVALATASINYPPRFRPQLNISSRTRAIQLQKTRLPCNRYKSSMISHLYLSVTMILWQHKWMRWDTRYIPYRFSFDITKITSPLTPENVHFVVQELHFLGYRVNSIGVQPTTTKVKNIFTFLRPTIINELVKTLKIK